MSDANNEVSKTLIDGVSAWLKESAQRLRGMLPNSSEALAQDGGEAIDDLTPHLTVDWDEAVGEFFLTG